MWSFLLWETVRLRTEAAILGFAEPNAELDLTVLDLLRRSESRCST